MKAFGKGAAGIGARNEREYEALRRRCEERLRDLEAAKPLREVNLPSLLRSQGMSRRDFLKWASATTALLFLPGSFEKLVARAAAVMNRVPVIWVEYQDCAGNSEAILRADGPTIDELLLDVISLEYNETLMAPAGFQAEAQLADAVETFRGKYILIVEGSIPTEAGFGWNGPRGELFLENLKRLSRDALAVIAVGSCASFGGIPAAYPNPTKAVGVWDVVKGKPIVNIPACPMNPANLVGVILHYVLTGTLPELDYLLRPKFAFGYRIHDNCERRAHFDAGEYVESWGDEGARNNFCLYKMGCKGPMTFNNCSIIRYNDGTNWPIGVGRGCIGCSEPGFWDKYAYERPMAGANIPVPGLWNLGIEKSVDILGVGLLTAAAAGIAIHAFLSAKYGKKSEEPGGGARPDKERP
ncbi:Ni-Fe hydrogenase Group 1b, small subunit [Methylacidimicrobium sp. AP8]|uniref:hydrogenase small subunit n=1 Tax=Methylacidimicrobium sp. AP8 TaxID=2730359 RepID=UPI0018C0C73D|nr:hydrogenase small subunit [Methylacidimicrobium sp. AP8]CAB4243716.1 Ni-Fe hydrogenase Group 1b, small subunit [Methylacidimicrobium sp. AP8]